MVAKLIVKRGRRGPGGDGFKALATILEDVPRALDHKVIRGLQSASQRGVGIVVSEIDTTQPYAPVNTGTLKHSVRSTPTDQGAILSVDAPYASFVERGTRPFSPPLAPLADWAMDKGIANDEDEAMAIARGIQAKFRREGMAPRFFFKRAMREIVEKVIPTEVKRELRNG